MPVFSSQRVMIPNVLANLVNNVASASNYDAVLPAKRSRVRPKTTQSIDYT